jgi:hypothetical protein
VEQYGEEAGCGAVQGGGGLWSSTRGRRAVEQYKFKEQYKEPKSSTRRRRAVEQYKDH